MSLAIISSYSLYVQCISEFIVFFQSLFHALTDIMFIPNRSVQTFQRTVFGRFGYPWDKNIHRFSYMSYSGTVTPTSSQHCHLIITKKYQNGYHTCYNMICYSVYVHTLCSANRTMLSHGLRTGLILNRMTCMQRPSSALIRPFIRVSIICHYDPDDSGDHRPAWRPDMVSFLVSILGGSGLTRNISSYFRHCVTSSIQTPYKIRWPKGPMKLMVK